MDKRREDILARIMQLNTRVCVRMRPKFPVGSSSKWYVDLGSVVLSTLDSGSFVSGTDSNGTTPEAAIENTWRAILRLAETPRWFFLIYDCAPNDIIPGGGPQVWVRWSVEGNRWMDVVPTDESLALHNISADRIRTFSDHLLLHRS